MKNLLMNILPQICHTTIYLARKEKKKKKHFRPENIRSLWEAVPKVADDLELVDTDVHHECINICTK